MYSIPQVSHGKMILNACIEKSSYLGAQHRDTKMFDDLDELRNFASSLLECRIISIRLYHGSLMPTGVVNGIQLVYKNLDNGKIYETTKRFGTHQFIGDTIYELFPEEFLIDVKVRSGDVIDYLGFQTSRNRLIAKGGKTGSERPFSFNGKVVVGMHGGYGGHLHNIGFYLAPKEEVKYWKRRPYILIKKKLEQNKDALDKFIRENQSKKDLAEIAFALLLLQDNQTFRLIMSFI